MKFKPILEINGWGITCEIALKWMSVNLADDKSTLVHVMAWCRQATSHYLSQWRPRSMSPYGITRPQWVKWIPRADNEGFFFKKKKWYQIWSLSPMPGEKHSLRIYIEKTRGQIPRFLSILRPNNHVFHTSGHVFHPRVMFFIWHSRQWSYSIPGKNTLLLWTGHPRTQINTFSESEYVLYLIKLNLCSYGMWIMFATHHR